MSDLEQPALLDSAADTSAPPETDTGTPSEAAFNPLDEDSPETGEATTEDEQEEELEGVKLRGKKEALEKLKAERLMQSDYTRKTQEVAEHRKNLEAREAQLQQNAQADQEERRLYGRLDAVGARLNQFQNVNWQAWADTDAAAASKAHMEFTQLQTEFGQLNGFLTHKQTQKQSAAEQGFAKRTNDAEAVVARELKDWSPEKYQKLQDYAKAEGVTPETLRLMLINAPHSAKIIDKALRFDQLQKQRTAKPAAEPSKPVTRVGGSSAVTTKDPERMSDAEFAAMRRRQIAQRR